MKKSNKILLSMGVGCIALFLLPQLILHVRYKKGIITREIIPQYNPQRWVPASNPKHILVRGVRLVNLVAWDSCVVVYDTSVSRITRGDTLIFSFHANEQDRNEMPPFNPPVTILYPKGLMIEVDSAHCSVVGADFPKTARLNLVSRNSELSFSPPNGAGPQHFDSLSITAYNSRLFLSEGVVIHDLRISIDDASTIDALRCSADQAILQGGDSTRINLYGSNLKKLILSPALH